MVYEPIPALIFAAVILPVNSIKLGWIYHYRRANDTEVIELADKEEKETREYISLGTDRNVSSYHKAKTSEHKALVEKHLSNSQISSDSGKSFSRL